MTAFSRPPIPAVVQQHVEEAAILRHIRTGLIHAPHVKLHQLRRLDERIAAHLDGIAVAGDFGSALCRQALESPGIGELFTATVRAIEERDFEGLDRLIAIVEAAPEVERGLTSAFGWVSSQHLQGTVLRFLSAPDPLRRRVGIGACVMHRVDPGAALGAALDESDPALRARALRAVGEMGRMDLLPAARNALQDQDGGCGLRAAWSAVLVGDRAAGLDRLLASSAVQGSELAQPMQLALRAVEVPRAHELLRQLAKNPAHIRALIQGAGIVGDAQYVPWLIERMDDLKLARLAGEAFSLITGLDLAYLDLERRPPVNTESGPTENPEDDEVAMDADDSLPWPDPAKIRDWWSANQQRFPTGTRHFMGARVSGEHCRRILGEGFQRQRCAASQYLCLVQPGTRLFNCAAPAWRQQRLLAADGRVP